MKIILATAIFLIPLTPSTGESEIHLFFREIWSPYCPGQNLLECRSSQAEQLRRELRQRLEEGETQEEVMADLEQRYGSKIHMKPQDSGRGSLAYMIPWIILGLAIGLIAYIAKRRFSQRQTSTEPRQASVDSETKKKVLKDLEERR